MRTPEQVREQIRVLVERMKARAEDPKFLAQVERIEKEEAARLRYEINHRRKHAGIPESFWPFLDTSEPTGWQPMADVRTWLESGKRFCLLAGSMGRGKSVAAAYAVDRQGGRFTEAAALSRLGNYAADEWDDLRFESFLVIDELGMEPLDAGGWLTSQLYWLLSNRYQDGRRTLLVTNLDAAGFWKRYGEGELARLRDRLTSSWQVYTYDGPSLRQVQP
jgi:DNA replication protein DnaC